MRRFLLVLAAAALPLTAAAQQGTVSYNETVKLNIELPPGMEEMADQIPDSQTQARVLYFTQSALLMKDAPPSEDAEETGPVELSGDGFRFRFDNRRPEQETYVDLNEGRMVELRDFLGRKFQITGDLPEYRWRLTGEQASYLGFACQKAVAEKDSTVVEAWFTPEIPVSAGPDGMNGLPGLILMASLDDGDRTFTATAVDLDTEVAGMITPPKGGRSVTRDEFDAIVEEKMEEMNAQGHGRGARVMIHRGN